MLNVSFAWDFVGYDFIKYIVEVLDNTVKQAIRISVQDLSLHRNIYQFEVDFFPSKMPLWGAASALTSVKVNQEFALDFPRKTAELRPL